MLNREFQIGWVQEDPSSYYARWDEFLTEAERKGGWQAVRQRLQNYLHDSKPNDQLRRIAALPISNFIECTPDRLLIKALVEIGKQPIVHDESTMSLGEWKIADPERPHVFCVLGNPSPNGFGRLSSLLDPLNGHVENILDMLRRKDLLLMNFDAWEAEYVLRLKQWAVDTGKIVNCAPDDLDHTYWAKRGVYVSSLGPDDFVDGLSPVVGRWYGDLDLLIPPEKVIDLVRRKPYDCFISYSRTDSDFVDSLDRSLRRRDVRTWRDIRNVTVGDPLETTIDAELLKAHCFVVVLSPEATRSKWVGAETERALALFERDEIAVIPVLYRDCEVPDGLRQFVFADFRNHKEREHSLATLSLAIRDRVARDAGKLR